MDNVTVTAARNYDHYRIGVVSVYGDDWYFCLTEDRRLLLSKTEAGEYRAMPRAWGCPPMLRPESMMRLKWIWPRRII